MTDKPLGHYRVVEQQSRGGTGPEGNFNAASATSPIMLSRFGKILQTDLGSGLPGCVHVEIFRPGCIVTQSETFYELWYDAAFQEGCSLI